jgi:hypothetical protein
MRLSAEAIYNCRLRNYQQFRSYQLTRRFSPKQLLLDTMRFRYVQLVLQETVLFLM